MANMNPPLGGDDDGDEEMTPEQLQQIFQAVFADPGSLDDPQLAKALQQMGVPADPASIRAMAAHAQRLMRQSSQGPVNWELATDIARQTVASNGDSAVGDTDQHAVEQALRTADLWLDEACDFPMITNRTVALSRAQWVEETMPTWRTVVEPIADNVGRAMVQAMQNHTPEEIRGQLAGALPMLRTIGGNLFGAQLGNAIGTLAGEVVGGGDTGLPLLPPGMTALVSANVTAFGQGLEVDAEQVRLYLAAREAAFGRLLGELSWLRAHIMDLVGAYASQIQIQPDAMEEVVSGIEPGDPDSVRHVLSMNLFEPQHTPEQQAALERLEVALALVEGWVDTVVTNAVADRLPQAAALRETVRRRRATGGPAEHTFASLIGLQLRPRRLREAAAVWAALTQARGVAQRDELWRHPDLVPSAQAFEDPMGFAQQPNPMAESDEMDAALTALLEGDEPGSSESQPPQPQGSDKPEKPEDLNPNS